MAVEYFVRTYSEIVLLDHHPVWTGGYGLREDLVRVRLRLDDV
jgi:hypothetical protein